MFFFRPGSEQKVAVIFEGGGGCWNDETCNPEAMKFKPIVNESDNPGKWKGILDFSRNDNPIKEFTSIFVPYCTADCHLGDSDIEYLTGTDKEIVIRHNGYSNAMSVVEWLFNKIKEPDIVFVTGLSAGAMPSPLYAGIIAEKYPQAHVIQIGDSGGAYRHEAINSTLVGWGFLNVVSKIGWLSDIDPKSIDFESLYIGAGKQSNLQLAQVNYLDDSVQAVYLKLLGAAEPDVHKRLRENLQEILSLVPSFRYYNMPGSDHTVLGSDQFYTISVNGIQLSDWATALIKGQNIRSIEPEDKAN